MDTIRSKRPSPCIDCPDRYCACSDHCKKPEYLKYREELATIRENRKRYNQVAGYTAKEIRKNRRVK